MGCVCGAASVKAVRTPHIPVLNLSNAAKQGLDNRQTSVSMITKPWMMEGADNPASVLSPPNWVW
jgi:hypothetical protein